MRKISTSFLIAITLLLGAASATIWRRVEQTDSKWESVIDDFKRSLVHHARETRSVNTQRNQEIIKYVETYKDAYEYAVKLMLNFAKGIAVLSTRIKSVSSIIGKVDRDANDKFKSVKDLRDIMGFRLTTTTLGEANNIKNNLNKLQDKKFKVTETECYGVCENAKIKYKSSGYRRIHMEILVLGKYAEVQIGTPYMDYWSNWDHDVIYKGPMKKNQEAINYKLKMAEYFYELDKLRNALPKCPDSLESLNVMEVLKTHLDEKSAQLSFDKMGHPPNGCFFWPDVGINHVETFQ